MAPLPLLVKAWAPAHVAYVSLVTTLLLAGPHLFAGLTVTVMERRFWTRHPYGGLGALLIAPLVIYAGRLNYQLLVGIFLFFSSLHLAHQTCHLLERYDAKTGRFPHHRWLQRIDALLVYSSFYPLATYRLVHGTFSFGGTVLAMPFIQGNPIVFIAAVSLFVVAVLLFAAKTVWDHKKKRASGQKYAFLGLNVALYFLSSYWGDLNASYQGLFLWHSLQSLALVWWLNERRRRLGEISSPFVKSISGKRRIPLFYLVVALPAPVFLALTAVASKTFHVSYAQCYLITAAAGLFVHYYLDLWALKPHATFGMAGR